MTLQAVEVSRQQTKSSDAQTGTREFLVFEDDQSQDQPTLQQAISATGIKLFRRDTNPVLGRLIPLEVNVQTDLEAVGKFKVSWRYGLEEITETGTEPGDPDFIDFSISQRPVAVDTYRIQPELNDAGTESILQDIEGQSVDSGGEPLTTFVRQQDLQLTVRSESFDNIPISTSLGMLSSRNSVAFLGAAPGFLLSTGLSVQRDGVNSYNTTLTFTFDEMAHRRQVPIRDVNGDIPPKNVGTSSEPNQVAKTVHLIQPFPFTSDFNDLGIPNPV